MPAPSLWLLIVEHVHGHDLSIHLDEEAARGELRSYVEQWWEQDGPSRAIPADYLEAVTAYFEASSESYRIEQFPFPDLAALDLDALHDMEVFVGNAVAARALTARKDQS